MCRVRVQELNAACVAELQNVAIALRTSPLRVFVDFQLDHTPFIFPTLFVTEQTDLRRIFMTPHVGFGYQCRRPDGT